MICERYHSHLDNYALMMWIVEHFQNFHIVVQKQITAGAATASVARCGSRARRAILVDAVGGGRLLLRRDIVAIILLHDYDVA